MRRANSCSIVAIDILLLLLSSQAHAYNPPIDTAGPLSVRIEGPEVVTKTEQPLPVRVVIANKGPEPVEGTVEVQLVDDWRAEPAQPVRFSVDGKASGRRPIRRDGEELLIECEPGVFAYRLAGP